MSNSSTETVIPGWMSCSEKDERGEELTPLERFVLDNEPAGIGEEIAFLAGLAAVLKPLNDEISALRQQVQELTHQRDSAHAEAMSLHHERNAR